MTVSLEYRRVVSKEKLNLMFLLPLQTRLKKLIVKDDYLDLEIVYPLFLIDFETIFKINKIIITATAKM